MEQTHILPLNWWKFYHSFSRIGLFPQTISLQGAPILLLSTIFCKYVWMKHFQQDGAKTHTFVELMKILSQFFENKHISIGICIQRSPDLTFSAIFVGISERWIIPNKTMQKHILLLNQWKCYRSFLRIGLFPQTFRSREVPVWLLSTIFCRLYLKDAVFHSQPKNLNLKAKTEENIFSIDTQMCNRVFQNYYTVLKHSSFGPLLDIGLLLDTRVSVQSPLATSYYWEIIMQEFSFSICTSNLHGMPG